MKKRMLLLVLSALLIIILSCNEDFNLNGPLDNIYVLNCILRGDTTVQYATIMKSYDVKNYDPYTNSSYPAVKGAKIKIFYNDSVFVMRDTVLSSNDPQYNVPISCYYINKQLSETNKTISVEALMPDGKILTSSTKTAPSNTLYYLSSNYIPEVDSIGKYKNNSRIIWELASSQNISSTNVYYLPRLEIIYTKKENGNSGLKSMIVPSSIKIIGNDPILIFPQISTDAICAFSLDAMTWAMNKISDGEANKKNYKVYGAKFSVILMDAYLATYYLANKTFNENLSVNLLPPDYSNITGGRGLFCFYTKEYKSLIIYPDYINSFGYNSE